MPAEGSDFLVEQSFTITGRGLAVVGMSWPAIWLLVSPATHESQGQGDVAVHRIDVEWVLRHGTERVAPLLSDLDIEQVPPGCLVRSVPPAGPRGAAISPAGGKTGWSPGARLGIFMQPADL
jgi:hypothetical protein